MRNFTLKTAGLMVLIALIFASFNDAAIAQNSEINGQTSLKEVADLSGMWVGTRYQYDATRTNYIAEFEYIFELTQDGNVVSGSSYIKNANEDFAEIKLRGKVVGDKLHFEEFAIMDQKKPTHKVWCFKIGALDLGMEAGVSTLKGVTNSFMSGYYFPCTGGFTSLERIDDYNPEAVSLKNEDKEALLSEIEDNLESMISVYPNPFMEKAMIRYTLDRNADVLLKVYSFDGKEIVQLVDENQTAADYNYTFNGNDFGFNSGAFIIELNIDGKIYSQQLIQVQE